jgi:hypothetical protein
MAPSAVVTGPADLRDQAWLDEQVDALGKGVDAAHAIWANWFGGRNVARLHPGMSPGEYIASRGHRLTLPEAMAALPDGSTREIAKVAGVSKDTVNRVRPVSFETPAAEPARVIGADGKKYPARGVGAVVIVDSSRSPKLPPRRKYPDWWRSAGLWLGRARKEDGPALRELDERVHAAMRAAGIE